MHALKRIALAAVLALCFCHFFFSAEAVMSRPVADFPIFLRGAQHFARSGQLYRNVDDLAQYDPGTPIYKYPPLFALVLLPMAEWSPAAASRFHFGLQIFLYVAAVGLLVGMLRHSGGQAGPAADDARGFWNFAAIAVAIALLFGPFFENLRGRQLEMPILALLILGVFAWRRKSDSLLGSAIGICAMLKVYPAFLLLHPLARKRWKAAIWAFAAMAAIAGACLFAFGIEENRKYFGVILPYFSRELPSASYENVSVARLFQTAFGASPELARGLARGVALPLVALSLWVVARGRSRDERRYELELSLFVALMLACMPNSWINYQLLLLLPVFVLLRHGVAERAWLRVVTPTLFACAMLLVSPQSLLVADLVDEFPTVLKIAFDLRALATLVLWATAAGVLRREASRAV